jgi:hypothetical protein
MSKASRWVEKVKANQEEKQRRDYEAEEIRPRLYIADTQGRCHVQPTSSGQCSIRIGSETLILSGEQAAVLGDYLLDTFAELPPTEAKP